MKKALTLAILCAAIFSQSSIAAERLDILKGTVTLNSKPVAVQVSSNQSLNPATNSITLGSLSFVIQSAGRGGFQGSHIVKVNNKIKEHKIVQIMLDPAFLSEIKAAKPELVAKEMQLDNANEFDCKSTDNALLLLSDEVSRGMIGNCMELK